MTGGRAGDTPAGAGAASAGPAFLAVDSGGSGLRVVVGAAGPRGAQARGASRTPVRTGARGIDPGHFMEQLLGLIRPLTAEAGIGRLDAAVVGAAGMASLGDALRAELPDALARELGVRRVVLAADAVTAYVGALGPRPGAVVAAGTGLVAVGTDLTSWRRADGWGHLLGDSGGGAWIGRAGLEAALRAHDGRDGGSARLLAEAEARFGPAAGLPGQVYPRPDRPAVLASFAPGVGACAADGDPVARRILRSAARHMAEAAAAVCPAGGTPGPLVAVTGGLTGLGDPLLVPLAEELQRRVPTARRVPAEGDPLHGSVRMATDLAADTFTLPGDDALLSVVDRSR
ncbi:N-acetylglucosamine kinase [Streptomyces sp. enrichment culture]|uniref:N-acetylglucosamine kinase n=1 Tax=Streptomyces sp. enrichment culture TaxID=1795815 RepID=UPI003F576DD7